jgi:hypothetical protein
MAGDQQSVPVINMLRIVEYWLLIPEIASPPRGSRDFSGAITSSRATSNCPAGIQCRRQRPGKTAPPLHASPPTLASENVFIYIWSFIIPVLQKIFAIKRKILAVVIFSAVSDLFLCRCLRAIQRRTSCANFLLISFINPAAN